MHKMKAQFNTLAVIVGSSFLHANNEGLIQHIGSNRRKLMHNEGSLSVPTCCTNFHDLSALLCFSDLLNY